VDKRGEKRISATAEFENGNTESHRTVSMSFQSLQQKESDTEKVLTARVVNQEVKCKQMFHIVSIYFIHYNLLYYGFFHCGTILVLTICKRLF